MGAYIVYVARLHPRELFVTTLTKFYLSTFASVLSRFAFRPTLWPSIGYALYEEKIEDVPGSSSVSC